MKNNNKLKLAIFALIIIIFSCVVYSKEIDVFIVNLKYSSGNINLESISTAKMNYFQPAAVQEGNYKIEIVSCSGKILYSEKFDFPLMISGIVDPNNPRNGSLFEGVADTTTALTESPKELIVPYFKEAKTLLIYDNDKIVVEYDLTVKYTNECKESKSKFWFYLIISFFLITILVIIAYLIKKKKEENLELPPDITGNSTNKNI